MCTCGVVSLKGMSAPTTMLHVVHRYLICSTTENLCRTLQELDTSVLVPYTPGEARALVAEIDALMQFT